MKIVPTWTKVSGIEILLVLFMAAKIFPKYNIIASIIKLRKSTALKRYLSSKASYIEIICVYSLISYVR